MNSDIFYLLVAGALLFSLLLGLARIYRGPERANRLLGAQLGGATTTALLLVLAEALSTPGLRDVALLLILLAAVLGVAFVRFSPSGREPSP